MDILYAQVRSINWWPILIKNKAIFLFFRFDGQSTINIVFTLYLYYKFSVWLLFILLVFDNVCTVLINLIIDTVYIYIIYIKFNVYWQ